MTVKIVPGMTMVNYHTVTDGITMPKGVITVPAIVVGALHSTIELHGDNEEPALSILVFDQTKASSLGGPDWSQAFVRRTPVLHASHHQVEQGKVTEYYTLAPTSDDEIDELAQYLMAEYAAEVTEGSAIENAIKILKAQKIALNTAPETTQPADPTPGVAASPSSEAASTNSAPSPEPSQSISPETSENTSTIPPSADATTTSSSTTAISTPPTEESSVSPWRNYTQSIPTPSGVTPTPAEPPVESQTQPEATSDSTTTISTEAVATGSAQ